MAAAVTDDTVGIARELDDLGVDHGGRGEYRSRDDLEMMNQTREKTRVTASAYDVLSEHSEYNLKIWN
jgi:hypothetical protein